MDTRDLGVGCRVRKSRRERRFEVRVSQYFSGNVNMNASVKFEKASPSLDVLAPDVAARLVLICLPLSNYKSFEGLGGKIQGDQGELKQIKVSLTLATLYVKSSLPLLIRFNPTPEHLLGGEMTPRSSLSYDNRVLPNPHLHFVAHIEISKMLIGASAPTCSGYSRNMEPNKQGENVFKKYGDLVGISDAIQHVQSTQAIQLGYLHDYMTQSFNAVETTLRNHGDRLRRIESQRLPARPVRDDNASSSTIHHHRLEEAFRYT
ncbi:hypothetical protein Syun_031077 [Stephania yunnanensis]|uniref:Uncharacterized protein n=1 Tax=Stephania yunnanensis TaxID=152371 RepID=A0AAP0HGR2_9MAGN